MLDYFTSKKSKKEGKQVETKVKTPIINDEDEHFLRRIISDEGTPPPLPNRPQSLNIAGDATDNQSQLVVHDDAVAEFQKSKAEKEKKEKEKTGRLSGLYRSITKKGKKPATEKPLTPNEVASETDDINRVLDDLNLSASNNRVFSISKGSQEIVGKFTIILKDLVNGVPTAYDDLVNLLNDSDGTLAKSYDSLPSFLQKLVTQLPSKLTTTLAPELLAVATEAQKFGGVGNAAEFSAAAAAGGVGGAAKSFLKISTLKDLVTKPGAVVSMLKYIMNALKLRWPAFMGTNVLLSLGLFILLFVFWYCHKRGRQVRLEKEGKPQVVDSNGRIVELEDDPMLEGPIPSRGHSSRRSSRSHSDRPGPSRTQSQRESDERRARRRAEHERQKAERAETDDRDRNHSGRRDRERRDRDDRDRDGHLAPSSPRSHRHADSNSSASRSGTERRSSRRSSRGGDYDEDTRDRKSNERR